MEPPYVELLQPSQIYDDFWLRFQTWTTSARNTWRQAAWVHETRAPRSKPSRVPEISCQRCKVFKNVWDTSNTYIYSCMYVYIYICIHMHIYIYICMYIYIHTYIHSYIHKNIHTDRHTYIYIDMKTWCNRMHKWVSTILSFKNCMWFNTGVAKYPGLAICFTSKSQFSFGHVLTYSINKKVGWCAKFGHSPIRPKIHVEGISPRSLYTYFSILFQ